MQFLALGKKLPSSWWLNSVADWIRGRQDTVQRWWSLQGRPFLLRREEHRRKTDFFPSTCARQAFKHPNRFWETQGHWGRKLTSPNATQKKPYLCLLQVQRGAEEDGQETGRWTQRMLPVLCGLWRVKDPAEARCLRRECTLVVYNRIYRLYVPTIAPEGAGDSRSKWG